ncbi:MAG TPA: hypothetical protein VHJ18_01000 [Streptosporangiaceae bacterium]|jgi:hypothetical protein|nr:hypothetical protein [Streptosporangiaceae bacterium]
MGTDDDSAVLLAEFRMWLDRERGLSPVSVRCYSKQAKYFLTAVGGPGAVSALDAGKVTAFVVGHSKDRNGWSAKAMVTSQVLRHRSLLSTSVYAKVDQDALRPLARPWPGAGK